MISCVPWETFSTVEGIMINVEGYLEYREGCSVLWGYHEYPRGSLEYRGGYHDARGVYHEYRGGYHPL